MDYDQRLHAQKDKRNEEKTMSVDENVFSCEATLRICSSFNIVEALKNCFDYLKLSFQKMLAMAIKPLVDHHSTTPHDPVNRVDQRITVDRFLISVIQEKCLSIRR